MHLCFTGYMRLEFSEFGTQAVEFVLTTFVFRCGMVVSCERCCNCRREIYKNLKASSHVFRELEAEAANRGGEP